MLSSLSQPRPRRTGGAPRSRTALRCGSPTRRGVAAARGDGVLGAEDRLEIESDGRGWARDIVERICVDRAGGLQQTCDRDGVQENYLSPKDHRIGAVLAGPVPPNVACVWSFDDGQGEPRRAEV